MELISKIDLLHWLLLCRHIGQGHVSMLEGKWERSKVWRLYRIVYYYELLFELINNFSGKFSENSSKINNSEKES